MKLRLTLVIIAILVTGCGESSTESRDVASEAFARVRQAGGLTEAQIRGRDIYRAHCDICHGVEGKGDGFNAYNLNKRPRDLTTLVGTRTPEDLRLTVTGGGISRGLSPLMPPYGKTLGPDGVDDVVSYIKTLAAH